MGTHHKDPFRPHFSMVIKTIRSLQELESVREYWEGWQYHPNTDFDHFKLVCKLRKEFVNPHVTVMERDGSPCALLIARMERTCFVPSIGYFKPFQIPANVLMVLYHGSLGRVDEEIGDVLIRHLWSLLTTGEADAVVFHKLPEDSPLLQALLVHGPRRWCEKKPVWSAHWETTLSQDPGFLMRKMKSKHRAVIRKIQRDLESAFPGRVSWRWISRFENIPEMCAQLEAVAARTYQRGLGTGFVNDEEHRQRYSLFASRGQLRIQLLEIEGKIRAFDIGIMYNDVFFASETGFDPDLREFSPGTLVMMQMADELVRERTRKLDFGLGDASYKRTFGDRSWRETTVQLFAPTAKGLALRSSLGIFDLLDGAGRHLMQKVGALDRLKTGWRRRLAQPRSEAEEK
jgi:hypothetical protein